VNRIRQDGSFVQSSSPAEAVKALKEVKFLDYIKTPSPPWMSTVHGQKCLWGYLQSETAIQVNHLLQ